MANIIISLVVSIVAAFLYDIIKKYILVERPIANSIQKHIQKIYPFCKA